jgi:hypothetical protein
VDKTSSQPNRQLANQQDLSQSTLRRKGQRDIQLINDVPTSQGSKPAKRTTSQPKGHPVSQKNNQPAKKTTNQGKDNNSGNYQPANKATSQSTQIPASQHDNQPANRQPASPQDNQQINRQPASPQDNRPVNKITSQQSGLPASHSPSVPVWELG